MKRLSMIMICLLAMMAASTSLKAQQVTIPLMPGWTWISYPSTDTLDFATALGSFTPAVGDIIESQFGFSEYNDGEWFGEVQQFYPGYGYLYYSSRNMPAFLTFNAQHPVPQLVVTTAEPTCITAISAVVGGTVTLPEGSHVFLRGVCWSTETNPDIDGNHTSDGTGIGSINDTLTGLTSGTTYYVRAYAVTDYGLAYGEELYFTTEHEYVDLGLPSGTLWATCNVGATTPEEYGDYFAWGETLPKETYNWSTYQYCNNGDCYQLIKYCSDSNCGYNGFTDNLTTLLPEDDVATIYWGYDWRVPTKEEWEELQDNTTRSMTTQNGVYGMLFTAANGNSLFLPAAGYKSGGNFYSSGRNYYWSSSLYILNPCGAWFFDFPDSNNINHGNRFYGQSVRAVRSSSQANAPTGAINGKFTINDNGDQVYFSQGNLQYIGSAATPYWKFAENQWDYFGTTTGQNSDNEYVDRDLFGWGTSGYNHGAVCYQPWHTSPVSNNYYVYGSNTYNLYDQTGHADWGFNSIYNGGNQQNQWRTLTRNEWNYLFNSRNTRSGVRYAKAVVNNVNGVILLPDNWETSNFALNNANSQYAHFSSNELDMGDWLMMESLGAVFLPAAGMRNGTLDAFIGNRCQYWSSSLNGSSYAFCVFISDDYLFADTGNDRCCGFSVRLVRDVE